MMKKIVLYLLLLTLVSVGSAQIESINSNYLTSSFSPIGGDWGLGLLSIDDSADIIVENTAGQQNTFAGSNFSMFTSLYQDVSAGNIAIGLFTNGALSITDSQSNVLLAGTISSMELHELYDNAGIMAGSGVFVVDDGSWMSEFGASGDIVQITFSINPKNINDFSEDFAAISNITLTPIPEPATLALMGIAGLALIRKRK
jgi:hypothetical protein